MITYLKMKKNEWKVKAQFYGMLAHVIDNQKDIIAMVEKLYTALKDESASNDLQTDKSSE